MKNISTLLSSLALLAVGVLFYLHFTHTEELKRQISVNNNRHDTSDFRIAYFDIDTLQEHFNNFKDAEDKIKTKESSSKSQLNELNAQYQRRLRELQEKAPTMTQADGEAAQRELAQLEKQFQQKELELDQELKKIQMDLMTDLHKQVEDYLKVYNQKKGYAYIFSYSPGVLMYYKDSLYDITKDMIEGLNAIYKKEKK